MSEEFSVSATFSMESKEELEALQECFELLDMEEKDEARQMMAARALQKAQAQQGALIVEGSDYDDNSDIVRMYLGSYQDSVDDHELTIDLENRKGKFRAEGYDHDAIDFCTAVVLVLIAMGATNIKGSASSSFWFARWIEGENHRVTMTFEAEA